MKDLFGYLVAHERAHIADDWRWLGFTMNLHQARLLVQDWAQGGHDPACSACVHESIAHIFAVPPDVDMAG